MGKMTRQILDKNMDHFWEVIQHIDWDSHYNYNIAKDRLNDFKFQDGCTIEDFEELFDAISSLITEETVRRVENNERVFKEGISHGADDCHFMDMPAHLIGLGSSKVKAYLDGGLIDFEPMECLSYMFMTQLEVSTNM